MAFLDWNGRSRRHNQYKSSASLITILWATYAGSSVFAGRSSPVTKPEPGREVAIVSALGSLVDASLCLDILYHYGAAVSDIQDMAVVEAVANRCQRSKTQTWQLRPDGTIYNVGEGRCLSSSRSYIEPLLLFPCNSSDPSQLWQRRTEGGTGSAHVVFSPRGDKQLTFMLASPQEGHRVHGAVYSGQITEKWSVVGVDKEPRVPALQRSSTEYAGMKASVVSAVVGSKGEALCLDGSNATRLVAAACNGSPSQQWRMRADGSLANMGKGLCVALGPLDDPLWLAPCRAEAKLQKWGYLGRNPGVRIRFAFEIYDSRECVALVGERPEAGAVVSTYFCREATLGTFWSINGQARAET